MGVQQLLHHNKRISFVTSATTSGGSTITIPSSAAAGDLCIITNTAGQIGGTAPGAVTPAGFTNVVNFTGSDGFTFSLRSMISWKILASGDPGSGVSGMGDSSLTALVFRPDNFTLSSITTSTPSTQGTSATPTNQTITLDAATAGRPLVSLAYYGSQNAVNSSISGGPTYTTVSAGSTDVVRYAALEELIESANSTVSMTDTGVNTMSSLTFRFT